VRIWERYKAARYDGTSEAVERLSKLDSALALPPEKRTSLTNDAWWNANFGSLFNSTNSNVSVTKDNTFGIAAYRRGVELRSQSIATMSLKILKDEGKGKETIYNHPLNTLIQEPNVFQTWFEFEVWMNAMKVGRGNGYAYIVRAKITALSN
jgi:phage portal protein BeeE